MKTNPINYDIIHDEHDIALLFNIGVNLSGASLAYIAGQNLVLVYQGGRRMPLAKCLPELWLRISRSDSILCTRMSANKLTKPETIILPVIKG